MNHAELIVVGAGSAGCLLASHLASQHGVSVTLVEPESVPAAAIDRQRPSRWLHLLGSSDDWNLRTASIPNLAGRSLVWPRGRGLGGSNRINAMIWFPPTQRDLRLLVDASNGQWTQDELNSAAESTRQLVQPEPPRWLSETSQRFIAAVDGRSDAVPMVYQRVNRNGRRWNPASLIRADSSPRSAIRIVRGTVDRLVWDGDRAVGVRVLQGTTEIEIKASRGIVLCAGSIASPAILMRSGIGPREPLRSLGIDNRIELPQVGGNLQDHLIMPVIFRTRSKHTLSPHPTVRDLARWQVLGTGPVGSNLAECGGLFQHAKFQIHVTPTNYLTYPRSPVTPTMTLGINLTQPASRGSILLRSRDPGQPPWIGAGYFNHDSDRMGTIEGVKLARSIAAETSLATLVAAEDIPGAKRTSDESIGKSVARYSQTLYHPVGTCAMGGDDGGVVGPEFAVRGTEALWIADASILPRLTIGNPNATVMTIAWMAAQRLAASFDCS